MKKVLSILTAFCILLSAPFVREVSADGEITVTVNGIVIGTDCAPYIKNDRTMVPMRAIFEMLGAIVTWDDATKTACGVKDETVVEITIGEKKLSKNGEEIVLDAAAEIVDGRTMVPVRAISEAFGAWVNWDDGMKRVVIKYDAPYGKATGFSDSRNCEIYWAYDSGTLTFSGMGSMPAYGFSPGYGKESFTVPKEWQKYFSQIEKIVVEEGITSIYSGIFKECINLKTLELGKNVRLEGATVTEGCIEELVLDEGAFLDKNIFKNYAALKTVTLKGEASISQCAFINTPFEQANSSLMLGATLVWRRADENESVITIEEGVEKIGDYVFASSKATGVVFPESLKVIGKNSFKKSALTSVSLNCEEIGEGAFSGSTRLATVTFGENVRKIGKEAFWECGVSKIVVPVNVTEIEDGAFGLCEKLTSAAFECDIKKLPDRIFNYCRVLTGVTLPKSLEEIGNYAFNGCYSLAGVEFPSSLRIIGEDAFRYCGFTLMEIPHGVMALGRDAFSCCVNLQRVSVPETVTVLPTAVFESCENLTDVDLPDTLIEIGHSAFLWCESLEEIDLPESVETIGAQAFGYCRALKALVLPEKVSSIPRGMASDCEKLTNVVIENENLEKIEYEAFKDCTSLWDINIPDNVKEVGQDVFLGTELYVNKNQFWNGAYLMINDIVFAVDFNMLTDNAQIPDGARVLANLLFKNSNIKEVIVPGSIENVSNQCFLDCKALERVVIMDGVQTIDNYAFNHCYSIKELVIPASVSKMEPSSYIYSFFVEKAIVPEHLAYIFEEMRYDNKKCEVVIQG